MTATILLLGMTLTAQLPAARAKTLHSDNPVYSTLQSDGADFAGVHVAFPTPLHVAGMSAEDERVALKRLVGSDRSLAEFTRDSVSAPFILKTRDETAAGRGVVRIAALWFVVRASLDDINPAAADPSTSGGKTVEAGNMRFGATRIEPNDLATRALSPAGGKEAHEWYVHLTSRLLDRIHVEATDRIVATKAGGSWFVGSITDAKFNADKTFPNRWHALKRQGAGAAAGADEVYVGSAAAVTISRLASVENALLIESHFAFFEPNAWFDGAPVLRSKIGVVAQDRIRRLRRDLAKSRTGEGGRSSSNHQND